jgi:hypothetical protein
LTHPLKKLVCKAGADKNTVKIIRCDSTKPQDSENGWLIVLNIIKPTSSKPDSIRAEAAGNAVWLSEVTTMAAILGEYKINKIKLILNLE